jgi:hypothetical protein
MRRPGRFNLPQRAVLVMALAGVLVLTSIYIITRGFSGPPGGGWFAYAPNTGVVFSDQDRLGSAATGLVWLVALVTWTLGSLWLLKVPKEADEVE